jgi:prepilin-type N-terminal cleavage/methylation domain-containing protein
MTPASKQQGLTLIELLVTMVILGFVIATLSGALTQISQMLRISSEQTNGFLGRWTQSRALYDIVANMVIDPMQDQAFKGMATRIELVSLTAPDAPIGQPRRLRLSLGPVKDQPTQTQIHFSELDENANSPSQNPVQWLATFEGRVEFRYVDKQQKEHGQWPIDNGQQTQQLPTAILLRDTDRPETVIRMAGYMGPTQSGNSIGQLMLGRP